MKAALVVVGFSVLALAGCGGGNTVTTVTVTATPSQTGQASGAASASSDGTLPFGQSAQTYPGLWVTVSKPRAASFSSSSSSDGDLSPGQMKKRTNFVQTVTYVNKTASKVDIGGEGASATVVSTGVECPRVFDTKVNPAAGTGPILAGGKRQYVIAFSCAGRPGEQFLVAAWAADNDSQGEDISFLGELP